MFKYYFNRCSLLLILLIMSVASGCGSQVSTATFTTELSLPPTLSALTSYQVQLTLYDASNTLVSGPLHLTQKSSRTWSANMSDFAAGNYLAQLEVIAGPSASSSPAALSVLRQSLVIAKARRLFSLPGGNTSTSLSFQPADFDTGIDEDSDGMTNLSEYTTGLDPFSTDTDQDGVVDGQDFAPLDVNEVLDEDHDGVGNNRDNCPFIANPLQENFDQDRLGDLCDPDRDNDGLLDVDEVRIGSNPLQSDTDQDGLTDGQDNCPSIVNLDQSDNDADHVGNPCDSDDDNDSVLDTQDNCPLVGNPDQADADGDHIGDMCSNDDDGDGIADNRDNCRRVANLSQEDFDRDGVGDDCDLDDDNDGLSDEDENGLGSDHMVTNRLATDTDGDGRLDAVDNCPTVSNFNQADTDNDGDGDPCDCALNNSDIRNRGSVFVSLLRGEDRFSGAQNQPVRTLARAIQIASTLHNATLYVSEGTFEEPISLPAGISMLGGFADTEHCSYSPEGHETHITNHESITFQVNVGAESVSISDVVVYNQGREGVNTVMNVLGQASEGILHLTKLSLLGFDGTPVSRSSQALAVENARVDLVNSILAAGEGRSTLGIQWKGIAGRFFHNTIHGGKAQQTSIGIKIKSNVVDTSLALINNVILTEHLGDFTPPTFDDQCVISYEGHGWPSGAVAKGNLLKPLRMPLSTEAPRFYCDLLANQLFSIDSVNSLDERLELITDGSIGSNITSAQSFSEIFAESATNDFHPILGSSLLDAGINPVAEALEVASDRDGLSRPQGGRYDIGAYELH